MTIIRNEIHTIPDELITDTNISPESFRLMCYLLKLPDNTHTYLYTIVDDLDIHFNMICKCVDRLEITGWITKHRIIEADGRYNDSYYTINQSPIKKEIK